MKDSIRTKYEFGIEKSLKSGIILSSVMETPMQLKIFKIKQKLYLFRL